MPPAAEPHTERHTERQSEPHEELLVFSDLPTFQHFLEQRHQRWPEQVMRTLRLIALHGIREPISGRRIEAAGLELKGDNIRESLSDQGCLARHRAILLVMERLIASGRLPRAEALDLYSPELLTPFASRLRQLVPGSRGSEYIPDPSDPRRLSLEHQDLCALSHADASFDAVVCNELFEHLYDLPAALREIARVLRPGGVLLSTSPLAYDRQQSIVKARHRPGSTPGSAEVELLTEPEFHGNPFNPQQKSLVYQIPGWDLLDQAHQAGLVDACFHWVASPSHGVVGQEIPAVIVFVAHAPATPAPQG